MPCCCPGESDVVEDKSIATEIQSLSAKGIERCKCPELQVSHECRTIVTLNIYHLTHRNKPLRKLGIGIFHVGVVIFGMEWSFGESIQGGNSTGLFFHTPGLAGVGFKTVEIGQTTLSPVQVDTILHRLENEWKSCDYHILHRNCNHFAQHFCDLLSTITPLRVPSWCNRAARITDKLIPRLIASKIQKKLNKNVQPPKASGPPGSSPKTKSGGSTDVSIDDVSSPRRSARNSILSGTPEGGVGTQRNCLPPSVIPEGWYNHPMIYQMPKYRYVANTDELTFPEWRIPEQCRNQRDRKSSAGSDGFWNLQKNSSGCFIHPSTLPTEMWCSQGEGRLIMPKNALKLDSSMNSTSCGYNGKLDGMEGTPETTVNYASPGFDTNPSSPQLGTEGCEDGSVYNPAKESSRCSVSSPSSEKVLLSCRPSPNVEVSEPLTVNASSFNPVTLMPSRRSVGRASPLPRRVSKMSQGFFERKTFSRSNSTDSQTTASSSWNSPQLHQEYIRCLPIQESTLLSESSRSPPLFSAASRNQSPLQSHIPLSAFSAVETTNVVLTHTSLASKEVRVAEQRFAADRRKSEPKSPAAPYHEENSTTLLQSLWSNRSSSSSAKENHCTSSVSITKVPSLDMIGLSSSPLDIKKISRQKQGRCFSQTWSFTRDIRHESDDSPVYTQVSGNLFASGSSTPRGRHCRAPSAPIVGNNLWMQ